jgi:hypothetical protein
LFEELKKEGDIIHRKQITSSNPSDINLFSHYQTGQAFLFFDSHSKNISVFIILPTLHTILLEIIYTNC